MRLFQDNSTGHDGPLIAHNSYLKRCMNMVRKLLWGPLALVVALLVFAACTTSGTETPSATSGVGGLGGGTPGATTSIGGQGGATTAPRATGTTAAGGASGSPVASPTTAVGGATGTPSTGGGATGTPSISGGATGTPSTGGATSGTPSATSTVSGGASGTPLATPSPTTTSGTSGAASTPGMTPSPTSAVGGTAATVDFSKLVKATYDKDLGLILTDSKGMTLYMFVRDINGQPTCRFSPAASTGGTPTASPSATGTPSAGGATGTPGMTPGATAARSGCAAIWPPFMVSGTTGGQSSVSTPSATGTAGGAGTPSATGSPSATTSVGGGTAATGTPSATSGVGGQTATGTPSVSGQAVTMQDLSKYFGVVTHPDGGQQVTFLGWPLYYYAEDTKPGDTNGQGLQGVWYVVSPAPLPLAKDAISATPGLGATLGLTPSPAAGAGSTGATGTPGTPSATPTR